jgi:succinyl-diaminopimelate desuccinylase
VNSLSPLEAQLDRWIDDHTDEIVKTTQELLRIPSVEGPAAPGAPFGIETVRALEFALEAASRYGLTTKNLDGYAGHAELRTEATAENAPIVGVLAHVDVVPEGDGWTHPPYGAEIENGFIFARGAIDDKGPAMAGLFALAAVAQSGAPLTHRIRLILGCDEESGFGCVKHYFAHEEMPVTGFTPDGCFPLIYAEKGIANFTVTSDADEAGHNSRLVRLTGGLRSNMVPDKATATLQGPAADLDAIAEILKCQPSITCKRESPKELIAEAAGVSAHGSTPELGTNAVSLLCAALLKTDLQSQDGAQALSRVAEWAKDTSGKALGIQGEDSVAGPLTANLGIARFEEGHWNLTFNVRYPVTWEVETVEERLTETLSGSGFRLAITISQGPLYVPQDDPLVKTLLEVYRAQTGDQSEPKTTGGGTYARAMTKGVAFGPDFPGSKGGGAHQADESWAIEDLIRATRIYARAILRLASQAV